MSTLRTVFLSLVLALVLLPNIAQAAAQAAKNEGSSQDQPGCKRSDLGQLFFSQSANQSAARPAAFDKKNVDSISPYCAQFACPWAHPAYACLCACDVEECDCDENCPSGPGHFFCAQGCRDQLNNCYVGCMPLP